MIPRKYAQIVFGLLLSGFMSLLVSGISTVRAASGAPNLLQLWLGAWLTAWGVGFPVVLLVAPLTRRLVEHLVTEE